MSSSSTPPGFRPGATFWSGYSQVNESRGESSLTVFPAFSSGEWKRRVIDVPASVPRGARATIELEIEEIEEGLRGLYPYESSGSLRLRIERLEALVKRAAARGGRLRREAWVLPEGIQIRTRRNTPAIRNEDSQ